MVMNNWILENSTMRLTADRTSGLITSLVIKDKNIDVLNGDVGYVAIEDGLSQRIFGENAELIKAEIDKDGRRIVFEKAYPEAGFTVREEIEATAEAFAWRAEVVLKSGVSRTISVFFVFPCLKHDSHLFVAHSDAPLSPEKINRQMYLYGGDMFRGEMEHTAVLPMATFYDPEADYGITVSQPEDQHKPLLQYFFLKAKPDLSFLVKYCHLALKPDKHATAEMELFAHEGDWRPGLKRMLDKYPDYFEVKGEGIFDSEGGMLCSTFHSDKEIKDWKANGFAWQEIHANVSPLYGLYVPEEESWRPVTALLNEAHLDLKTIAQIESIAEFGHAITSYCPSDRITKDEIRKYIELLHQNGIAAFMYINPVLCLKDYAPEFPDAMTEAQNGRPLGAGYYYGYSMNPDPDNTWGKHIIKQVKALLDTYPEMDGIFLDELHYRGFDFAHNDGITMVDNRPCYMLGFGVEKLIREMCDMVRARGKVVWANGPSTLQAARHIDGFMAEGAEWWWLGSSQYLGLIKPLVALQQTRDLREHEVVLKHCLITGAQPSVPWGLAGESGAFGESKETMRIVPDTRKEMRDLFSGYKPLLEQIKHREWVLTAHALTLPPGVRGNIFKVQESYVVTVVSMDKSVFDDQIVEQRISLSIRVPEAHRLTKVRHLSADTKAAESVSLARGEDGTIDITIPHHKNASVILLARRSA